MKETRLSRRRDHDPSQAGESIEILEPAKKKKIGARALPKVSRRRGTSALAAVAAIGLADARVGRLAWRAHRNHPTIRAAVRYGSRRRRARLACLRVRRRNPTEQLPAVAGTRGVRAINEIDIATGKKDSSVGVSTAAQGWRNRPTAS